MLGRYISPPHSFNSLNFNHRIAKSSSSSWVTHENKQNLHFPRNPLNKHDQFQPHKENSSSFLNISEVALKNSAISKAALNPLNRQNCSLLSQKVLDIDGLARSPEQVNNRNTSKSMRSKSVKFSDQHIQMSKVQSSLNLGSEAAGKRASSILKNSQKYGSSQQLKSKSHFKYEQNKLGNVFTISEYKNTLVRERYNQIMRSYQKHIESSSRMKLSLDAPGKRYADHNFALSDSSVFRQNGKKVSGVEWVRISQIFKGKDIALMSNRSSLYRVVAGRLGNPEFAALLNLIGQSRSLLNRVFQNSAFNQMGVYMLKVFHETEWKCVIVDDYLPVLADSHEKRGSFRFLFTELSQRQAKQVEIWPLLLQKAYASLLGCYESVHEGHLLSYIVEMMGLPLAKVNIKQHNFADNSSIMFSFLKSNHEKGSQNHRQLQKLVSLTLIQTTKQQEPVIQIQHHLSHNKKRKTLIELRQEINELFVISIANMQYYATLNIGSVLSLGKKIKNQGSFKQDWVKERQFTRQKPIIKTFSAATAQQISVHLKFKSSSLQPHQTFWLRAILLMKQHEGYRWIEGKYGQNYLYFTALLQPGDYFLILLPDWTQNYTRQLSLTVYSRVNKLELKNHSEAPQDNMLEKGCSDYAQRRGKLIQINKSICAYTIVDSEAGLIVENIHNQRRNGSIRIYRSVRNLKPKAAFLLPYNREFYSGGMRPEIEVAINKLQSYSVVMLMFGGKDSDFLATFSFGP